MWQKIFRVKKNQVQNYLISCGSLSLKFHAILLARSGVMGFVSVESRESRERVERVVLVKINEMALKVPSQYMIKKCMVQMDNKYSAEEFLKQILPVHIYFCYSCNPVKKILTFQQLK